MQIRLCEGCSYTVTPNFEMSIPRNWNLHTEKADSQRFSVDDEHIAYIFAFLETIPDAFYLLTVAGDRFISSD